MSGYHKRDWETFPMEQLKRVDRPTTQINEKKIQRVRERDAGFCKAAAGDSADGPRHQPGILFNTAPAASEAPYAGTPHSIYRP